MKNNLKRGRIPAAIVLLAVIAASGCSKYPDPAAPAPAPAAAGATDEAVAAQPSAESSTVAILYAQIGKEINLDDHLVESLTELSQSDDVYALAVFRGTSSTPSTAAISVSDSSGVEAFSESKEFTPGGETPVIFKIKPATGPLAPGEYKALVALNGQPCWELTFKIL